MVDNKEINNDIKPSLLENLKSVSALLMLFFILLILVKGGYDIINGANIFGDKNTSFFDAWSLEHIISFKDSMFLHKNDFGTIISTLFSIQTVYAIIIVSIISFGMNKLKG